MKSPQTIPQQIERFDMYTQVHKGLRAFMVDTLTAVGRIDPGNEEEVADGIVRTRALIDVCGDHLNHEERFIHPAMEGKRPGSSSVTSNDHVHHQEAFERLTSDVFILEHSASIAGRRNALSKLYLTLSLFVAENFQHMHVEETDNAVTLWELYTDEQLAAIHTALVSAVAPERMVVYLRWMIPSMSHPERIRLLKGIEATAPRQVFEGVLQVAESRLSPEDWSKLADGIGLTREFESVLVS